MKVSEIKEKLHAETGKDFNYLGFVFDEYFGHCHEFEIPDGPIVLIDAEGNNLNTAIKCIKDYYYEK